MSSLHDVFHLTLSSLGKWLRIRLNQVVRFYELPYDLGKSHTSLGNSTMYRVSLCVCFICFQAKEATPSYNGCELYPSRILWIDMGTHQFFRSLFRIEFRLHEIWRLFWPSEGGRSKVVNIVGSRKILEALFNLRQSCFWSYCVETVTGRLHVAQGKPNSWTTSFVVSPHAESTGLSLFQSNLTIYLANLLTASRFLALLYPTCSVRPKLWYQFQGQRHPIHWSSESVRNRFGRYAVVFIHGIILTWSLELRTEQGMVEMVTCGRQA